MKTLTVLPVALASLALFASPVSAVTFGAPDNNGHPWVGTLLFQAADLKFYSCSGTLLAPKVMVTAAHCTIEGTVKNLHTWVKFAPVISFADRGNQALFDYLDDPAHGWIKATEVIPHPQYSGHYPNTYDVGIVKLSKAVDVPTYADLPPVGFLDTVPKGSSSNGNLFTVVGYGMQGYIKPFYSNIWERYVGNVRLVELKSTFNGAEMSAKFTNNPGRTSGGSCYGDSGGPVFYGTGNLITAVVSWGITPCIGVDYNFRLDTPVAQDFIRPYLN